MSVRSYKSLPSVEQYFPEPEHKAFFLRRVKPLLEWWGRFIGNYTLEQLCVSCYAQGVDDALQVVDRPRKEPEPTIDFQI